MTTTKTAKRVHWRSIMEGDNITAAYKDANGIDITRTATVATIGEENGSHVFRTDNGGIIVYWTGAEPDVRFYLNKAAPVEHEPLF